jgi:dolichyl-phosphate-mannose-protein mannosyltransferase
MLSNENETVQTILPRFSSKIVSFIEERRLFVLAALCLLYVVLAFYLSSRKLLWNDELYTLYFARLRLYPDLWKALATGADQIPPTFILLTKASIRMFGEGRTSMRIPEFLGFLLASLCLYRIVSIRTSAIAGFLAFLFPTMTAAFGYMCEARGYALVLGCSALAFCCWQAAAYGKRRKLQLAGLVAGLAGALMSHYYGILLFLPLIVGEIVRSRSMQRIDWPIWCMFVLSVFPLALFFSLIQASAAYGGNFWAKPEWQDVFLYYGFLLKPAGSLLVFILITFAIIRARSVNEVLLMDALPTHEVAAALAFVLIPALAVIGSKFTTGALTARHVLLSIIGFSILIPCAIHRFSQFRILLVLSFLLFFFGWMGQSLYSLSSYEADAASYNRTVEFIEKNADSSVPVVCWFVHPAQQVWYYGPKALSDRLYYLADPVSSKLYLGHDTIDRGMLDLEPWFPTKNVQPYDRFTASNRTFLLYYCAWEEDWRWNWIVSRLLADHRRMELLVRRGDQYLFKVDASDN